jgi:hypothetical protein
MINIEKTAENLFDKIRSRFAGVTIGDESAKATVDPENARFFNFDFVADGKNFGNITISLIDADSLKVYFDKEIDGDMTEQERHIWYDFLKNIRLFAKRNMMSFDVRDIAKSGLELKDLRTATKNTNTIGMNDVEGAVTESKLYGTRRSSYQKLEDVRIIARHSKPIVDETIPGARSRNIQAFYIENSLGERVRCPDGTTFNGARVYARHVKNGGAMHDDFGKHITKLIGEMTSLKNFVRNVRGKTFEDAETNSMIESAVNHYGKLHRDLFTMRGQRGYHMYKSLWQPEVLDETDVDLDEIRDRFTRRVFDERLTDALPIVQRAYQEQRSRTAEEFESWANGLVAEYIEEGDDTDDFSPFANNIPVNDSGDVLDSDDTDQLISELLDNNGFTWRFTDGAYYLESKEEIERAKDIIAANDPHTEFPPFEVTDRNSGDYGSSTFDRELTHNGVHEDVNIIKQLAGIAK